APTPAIQIVAHGPIRGFESARRAGRRRIPPGEPTDREFNVRPQLRKLDLLGPLEPWQLPPLQEEDAVRALGEDVLPCAPRPLFVARSFVERLRPVRNDFVTSENVLATPLARHCREPDFLFRLSLNRSRSVCEH